MFEPNFDDLKASLVERFKSRNPEDPFEGIVSTLNQTAADTAEKFLQEYHRQLWEELKRQGVVK